ncbi:MAG: AgmX/PglI C-terminal domain-containing protein [Deltaproteobacteria bacterium]|nr:AgmX/PglI C-terminal domain-containing protein [Deltaproteobacteria bacterium]
MIIKADGDVQDASFEQDSIIVGSGASANVQLDDDKVSSIHAMIKVDPEKGIRVIDLGSESGTRIGGKEIREESIDSGDVVEIGGCKIRVSFGDGAEAGREMTEVVSVPEAAAESDEKPAKKDKKKAKKAAAEAPVAAPASKEQRQSTEIVQALQPEGDTMKLFSEEIPESERPTSAAKLLEVVMVWSDTIIGLGHFELNQKQVTVGDGKKNDFNLANDRIPLNRFPFLQAEGDTWKLVIAEGMDLKVRDGDGDTVGLDELKDRGKALRADTEFKGYTYKLGLHDQAMIYVDDTVFVVRYVKPSKRIVTNVWTTLDFYFTKVLSTSFMAHILFIAALLFTPINAEELSEDLFKNPNRFAKLIIKPPETEKKKFKDLSGIEEGKKAKDDEGKFGKKEEVKKEAAPSKKGAPVVDVDKREEDRKKVMQSGLLAALNAPDDGAASNVFGPGGLGTGINNALGGLQGGAGMGDAHGVGGLGSRGTGPGGGGSALGIGGLGTKGGGRGRGGYGSVDLGGKGRGKSNLSSGTTIVKGGLDKEVIARIVRRHQNEIKYCYERELQKDPNLYGKIAILWIIDATGAVAKATVAQTTMGNSEVENCIITRVKRWRFPQPKGGGIVQVTYPWIFKPSN